LKINNLIPAMGLWVAVDILFYIAAAIYPATKLALAANMFSVGTLLAILIGFWAGKTVGKQNYTDSVVAGIAVGLACLIPFVALFGYGGGMLPESIAFGAVQLIVSIAAAIVGNAWK
jgi:hypothetical protein